jgi:hypothetical protein
MVGSSRAWPIYLCMARRVTPASRRCVAEQWRRVGMPPARFRIPACGWALRKAPWYAAAMHGVGGGWHGLLLTASGGKKPGGMAGCCPGVSPAGSRLWRAGDGAVLGPRAPMHVAHASLAVDGRNWAQEFFVQSESQARDGGKVHTGVQGGGHAEQATNFLHTKESGEPVCGWSSHEGEELPSTFQNG